MFDDNDNFMMLILILLLLTIFGQFVFNSIDSFFVF